MQQREELTIKQAARLVNRAPRTIQRWMAAGLASHDRGGIKHVWLDELQAAFVARLETDVTRPQSPAALECGTIQRYWNGCRCDPCRSARSAYMRALYAKRVQETAARRARAAGQPVVLAVPRPYRRRTHEAA